MDGDNSGMLDEDDGEVPSGSGTNNDGGGAGAEGGEGKQLSFALSYICHGDLERFTTFNTKNKEIFSCLSV